MPRRHTSVRRLLIPMVLASAWALTACAASRPSAEAPVALPQLPGRLAGDCARPVELPARALTQAEVETLWARDRAALVSCGIGKSTLVAFYTDLRQRLGKADRSSQ